MHCSWVWVPKAKKLVLNSPVPLFPIIEARTEPFVAPGFYGYPVLTLPSSARNYHPISDIHRIGLWAFHAYIVHWTSCIPFFHKFVYGSSPFPLPWGNDIKKGLFAIFTTAPHLWSWKIRKNPGEPGSSLYGFKPLEEYEYLSDFAFHFYSALIIIIIRGVTASVCWPQKMHVGVPKGTCWVSSLLKKKHN